MLMQVRDLFLQFTQDVLPVAVPLCVVIAAAMLWRRTKRASALVQLLAAVLLLYGTVVDRYGSRSIGLDRVRSEWLQTSMDIALFLGCVSFPIAYLTYALREKRI